MLGVHRNDFAYLLHKNIPISYRHKNRLQSGLLYTDIVGVIARFVFTSR